MNFLSPFSRQLIVASSPQLAALSLGGLNGYPAVLLSQLNTNDSSIAMDLDSSSWVASIHGLAGIPSIFIPTLMQWKGRRFAFITTCLSIFLGWILIYFSTTVSTILIGECFQGFGAKSLNAVSLIAISEMIDPKYRSTSMVLFGVIEMMGLVVVTISGYFFHWKTVSLIFATPVFIALLLVIVWPESPSWLACQGHFQKCEEAFIQLRGTGKEATKELKKLLKAQHEIFRQESIKGSVCEDVWIRLKRKDFRTPIVYMIIIMFTFYFSGPIVTFTYMVEIIASTTGRFDFTCFFYIDVVIVLGSIVGFVLLKYFNNKTVLIFSYVGSGFFLLLSSVVIYCKDFDIIVPVPGLLVCVLANLFCNVFGSCYLTFNMSTELIPVKHRGLGGSIYIIIGCLFHSGSLKISPYLFKSIGLSGTFIIFAVVAIVGLILIWKIVPETKGKTLQEIEDAYNFGSSNQATDYSEFEISVLHDDFDE